MYVCVPYLYLEPMETRRLCQSFGTGIRGGYEPRVGAGNQTLLSHVFSHAQFFEIGYHYVAPTTLGITELHLGLSPKCWDLVYNFSRQSVPT